MLNSKVILLCGYSRGGTNIVWNILQSHPRICSAMFETNHLVNHKEHGIRQLVSLFRRLSLQETFLFKRIIDYKFYKIKMTNYFHSSNTYIYPDKKYTRTQVYESAICFKSVDKDINYTDLLINIYPNLYLILLTRNGYAFAEGHLRRGSTIEEASKLYQSIADRMKYYTEVTENYKFIKFEDVLNKPFEIADDLYNFTESHPNKLDYLRLKSKKIITDEGKHEAAYGNEKNKYWFNKKNIFDLFDPAINEKQINNLSSESIKIFNKNAKSALKYFGYDLL